MTEFRHQTVRITKGRQSSPAHGTCVIELASMLAGERFSDHPQSVCPVIAGFLRAYNDLLTTATSSIRTRRLSSAPPRPHESGGAAPGS